MGTKDRRVIAFAIVALLLAPRSVRADDGSAVIITVGAAGDPSYAPTFRAAAQAWRTAATQAGARIITIGDGPVTMGTDRDSLRDAIAGELGRETGLLWIILLGHGTDDGRTARFNLRGPDLAASDLAAWIKGARRPLVIIDTTAASASFIKPLTGPNRIIISATRSGRERSATRLNTLMPLAINDPAADLDKDGQTSVWEAFVAASTRADLAFSSAGLIPSEHALLDDNGDGQGTAVADLRSTTTEGTRARQVHLVPSAPERALSPEQKKRRDDLEQRIADLRARREALAEADYYTRLEPLLLALARLVTAKP